MTLSNFFPRAHSQVVQLKERFQDPYPLLLHFPNHFKSALVACLAVCRRNKSRSLDTLLSGQGKSYKHVACRWLT